MTADEEKISRLYKQGKEPGPSVHLDNAILSAARDAVQDNLVQDRQQAKKSAKAISPFSGGWRAPASIAAVLVITVILVPLLQQEEISPDVSRVADDVPILKKEQDLIKTSDVRESDIRKSGAAKENRAVSIKAKKRLKTAVLEQEKASQLYQAPAKPINKDTFSRGKQFAVEEKIAPVKTATEMSESLLSPAQQPQPASAAVGATMLDDQEPYNQDRDQELRTSDEIKQQGSGMFDADKTSSVTMAAKPWLQKIRQLIAQGNLDLAHKEFDEFKLHYPDEYIDPSILNQLK